MRIFRMNFWYDENGNERDWRAMTEAEITALIEPNRRNGLNSITELQSFDFSRKITKSIRNGPTEERNEAQFPDWF
jgi:hypothetical protein